MLLLIILYFILFYCFSVLLIVVYWALVCRILKCSFLKSSFLEKVAEKLLKLLSQLVHWLWCSSAAEQHHTSVLFLQICVKSQQRWQEKPHYIGTLMTINQWKRLGRCLSHSRRDVWARTEAVFPCFTAAFRILQSDVIGDYLPQSSHWLWLALWPAKVPLGSWWVGKSVERREEGTPPQTLDCRSVWWYPHQWFISENLVLLCV